jgi:hypothetical protein
MRSRLLPLSLSLVLALGAVTGAHAQSGTAGKGETAVLPVWNNASGKLEAVLVLEPADQLRAGARWRFGSNSLDAAFGLDAGDSLALLCDRKNGIAGAIGNLANNCLLASLGDEIGGESRRVSGTAAFTRGGGRLGVTAGSGRDNLPGWLTPGAQNSKVDINDLTVFAQKNISTQGYVSIAGTVAKARLLSPAAAQASGLVPDQWTSRTLAVGGGFGAFGANIVGHVIDTPGQPKWEGLGLGLTWRTPWSGQLTVGADNVITRGRNPFSPTSPAGDEEGTVPYVRYEQDL